MPSPILVLICGLTLAVGPRAMADPTLSHPPLTDQPGDPVRGQAVVRDASRASCLICHSIATLPDRDQGGLGPPLDGVAARLDAGQMRQRIVDARRVSPDTIMPPYHATADLFAVGAKWVGQTLYSAQDVEDVVAFLMTLKD